MGLLTKVLNFNTVTATNKSNPQFILNDSIDNVNGYCVTLFQGVNSFYDISARNNQLQFIESPSQGTIRTVVLPVGNYTVDTALLALQAGLNSQASGTYTVTNNPLTNRITITSNTSFMLKSITNDMYYEFGFESFDNTFNTTHTGTNSYDFSGIKTLNIVSYSFGYGNNIVVNKSLNVIASIPINNAYLAPISYTGYPLFVSAQIPELSVVEFLLVDERFRPISTDKDYTIQIALQI
jgi:hypothetical protein